MLNKRKQNGFSLAEVLMALGILAMGMVLIAGVFPAGIYFTAISTERTMATVIADEAFAKIRLYGVDLNSPPLPLAEDANPTRDFSVVSGIQPPDIEFLYPSDLNISEINKQYCWSALCRRASGSMPGETLVQVTVFVSRKSLASVNYYQMQWPVGSITPGGIRPVPVRINVAATAVPNQLNINDPGQQSYIAVGSTIVDDSSGRIYKVQGRDNTNLQVIILDRPWVPVISTASVWVIPPPVNGGRYPCVGVYQKEIIF